jgi:GNAT superfamily N-acetyltransferase
MNRDELLEACFGKSDFPEPNRIFEMTDGADVLSHVDVYFRRVLVRLRTSAGPGISAASETITVAAIGQVCTDPDHRGRGLASALLASVHEWAASHETIRFAALFAGGEQRPFYERLGYSHPDGAEDAGFLVRPLERRYEVPDGPDAAYGGDEPPPVEVVETPIWPDGRVDTRGTW